MKTLIIKDLYLLKGQLKSRLLSVIIVTIALSIFSDLNSLTIIPFISMIMSYMSTNTTLAFDEYSNWDRQALIMPVDRADIVNSKYLLTFLSSIIGSLLALGLYLILNIRGGLDPKSEILVVMLASLITPMFLMAITIPLYIKYGLEKTRYATFIIFMGTSILGTLVIKGLNLIGLNVGKNSPYLLLLASLILIIALIFFSIKLSKSLYSKKEFS